MAVVLGGGWNFRDVADSTGGAIKPGRLFRSGELSRLDDDGRATLRDLSIGDVADLRSPREVERNGAGLVTDDVVIHLLPFPDAPIVGDEVSGGDDAPHEHSFRRLLAEDPGAEGAEGAAHRYMVGEYERFARFAGARRAVHRLITLIGAGKPVITQCYAGKDRTGFAVATVLEAAGVERDAIVADYLASNAAVPQLREQILLGLRERNSHLATVEALEVAEARLNDEVLGVRQDYLEAARRVVDEDFGGLQGYLQAADVTSAHIEKLRAALLD